MKARFTAAGLSARFRMRNQTAGGCVTNDDVAPILLEKSGLQ